MSDNKKDGIDSSAEESRRTLLKKLSAGGTGIAVAKWTAPIIATIAIPAHAQTSFGVTLSAVAITTVTVS